MRDTDWWPLSAAVAWIACRKALTFSAWDEAVAPPRPVSQCIMPNANVPSYVAAKLAEMDDGVRDALDAHARALFEAASGCRVAMRGRGPWSQDDGGEERARTGELVLIPPSYFTRPGVSAYSASEALGPGEAVADFMAFPGWSGVEASACQMREEWPATPLLEEAVAWLKAHGNGVKKRDEPAVMAEFKDRGLARATARQAFDLAFGRPGIQGRPKKIRPG